jgi:hypothetical protein
VFPKLILVQFMTLRSSEERRPQGIYQKRLKPIWVLDKGYTGVKKEHPLLNFLIPFRRSRGKKELSRAEKIHNTKLSKIRVLIEHVIAKVKKYRILSEVFRNSVEYYNQDFKNIAALINFRNFRLEFTT